MLATSMPRKPTPMLAMWAVGARGRVGPHAFGNAVGSSLASASNGDPLGDFINQNQGAWDARSAEADRESNRFAMGSSLDASGQALGAGSGDPIYDSQMARMRSQLVQEAATTSVGPAGTPFRVEISGIGSSDPEAYNAQVVWLANKRGEDLAPTMANADRLHLFMGNTSSQDSTGGISLGDAIGYDGDPQGIMAQGSTGQRFVTGAATGLWKGLTELPLEVTDMTTALWNVTTGDNQFVGYSMLGQKAMNGAGTGELSVDVAKNALSAGFPIVAAGRSAYNLTEAIKNGDPEGAGGAFVGLAGSALTGYAMGYGTTGIEFGEVSGPMMAQRGAIAGYRLVDLNDVNSTYTGDPTAPDFVGPLGASSTVATRLAELSSEGHALGRHGGSVTDQQLATRALTGVAPDGSFVVRDGDVQIPSMSSAFNSDAALAQADLQLRQNYLDQAVALSKPGAQSVTIEGVDMGTALGRGYGRITTTPGGTGPLQLIDNLTSVTGVYRFNPASGTWQTVTIYPVR